MIHLGDLNSVKIYEECNPKHVHQPDTCYQLKLINSGRKKGGGAASRNSCFAHKAAPYCIPHPIHHRDLSHTQCPHMKSVQCSRFPHFQRLDISPDLAPMVGGEGEGGWLPSLLVKARLTGFEYSGQSKGARPPPSNCCITTYNLFASFQYTTLPSAKHGASPAQYSQLLTHGRERRDILKSDDEKYTYRSGQMQLTKIHIIKSCVFATQAKHSFPLRSNGCECVCCAWYNIHHTTRSPYKTFTTSLHFTTPDIHHIMMHHHHV